MSTTFEYTLRKSSKLNFDTSIPVDFFTAAVGFEIVNDSVWDAKQFAEDVIDCEEKEYLRLVEEFHDDIFTIVKVR